MKLCKDCKHYRLSEAHATYSICVSPDAHADNASFLANGLGSYADVMRKHGLCGIEGKCFDPIGEDTPPPVVKKWWEFWK